MPEFSSTTRARNLDHLRSDAQSGPGALDLLVIGGGVTGTGIAWDAALRGLRVACLEKVDFGSGTSGRSARLIHGGLRYLAQFQLGLVYESTRERRTLLRIAPHLVKPLPFLYPLYKGGKDRRFVIRTGMWMYDGLALFRSIHIHRMLNRKQTLRSEPCVRPEGARGTERLLGAAEFYDAQVDDARLALATAQAAHRAGSRLANHVRVSGFVHDGAGQVCGVTAIDELSGEEFMVSARVVVNATGVWAEQLMGQDDPQGSGHLRPTKGIHIVVDHSCFCNSHAIVFTSPRDERMLFLVPSDHFAFIGTTETDYSGSLDEPFATSEDVEYLLEAANQAFPQAHLTRENIISTWAGVRPLIGSEDGADAYDVSREHEIFESSSGLLSVAGGKLTTFRHMAEQIVDRVVARLASQHGLTGFSQCCTDDTSLDPAPLPELQALVESAGPTAPPGCSGGQVGHLISRFGSRHQAILQLAGQEPELGQRIVADLPYLWAEVDHALNEEMVLTLSDMLVRRIPLIHAVRDQGLSVAPTVAARMARPLGWDQAQTAAQIDSYKHQVDLTRRFHQTESTNSPARS
jgi:glycerol-3-phosphate dehydrogenase